MTFSLLFSFNSFTSL